MEATLREYLMNNYKPNGRGYDGETFANLVGDYYSCKGMEWTADDMAAIREYGYDPQDYLNFTDEQLCRLDEIQDAAIEFCKKMIQWPDGHDHNCKNAEIMNDLYGAQIWCQIADYAAKILETNGFYVHFPTHVEVNDDAGTEYITDEWGM